MLTTVISVSTSPNTSAGMVPTVKIYHTIIYPLNIRNKTIAVVHDEKTADRRALT